MIWKDKIFTLIFQKASVSLLIRILGVIIMFFAHIILARVMPVSEYGLFIYAVNLIAVVALVLQGGFQASPMRFMYEYQQQAGLLKGYLITGVGFVCIVSFVVTVIFQFVSRFVFLPEIIVRTADYILWVMVVFAAVQVVQHYLRAIKYIVYSQVFEQIMLPLCLLLFGAWALFMQTSITFEAAITLYGGVYSGILFVILMLFYCLLVRWTDVSASTQYKCSFWIRTSLPMGLAVLSIALLSRLDVILLGFFVEQHDIAQYGVASRIAGLLLFGMAALGAVLDPIISELYYQKKKQQLSKLVSTIMRFVLLGGGCALLFLWFFGASILGLFGNEYMEAKPLLLILALGQMLNLSAGPSVVLLNVSGHQKSYMKLLLLFVLLNICALFYAIPQYGVFGAAVTTTTLLVAMNISLFVLIYRKTSIRLI